jgi:hypothetical protein
VAGLTGDAPPVPEALLGAEEGADRGARGTAGATGLETSSSSVTGAPQFEQNLSSLFKGVPQFSQKFAMNVSSFAKVKTQNNNNFVI